MNVLIIETRILNRFYSFTATRTWYLRYTKQMVEKLLHILGRTKNVSGVLRVQN